MKEPSKFDSIRSFTDAEAKESYAMAADNHIMQKLIEYVYPGYSVEQMREFLLSLNVKQDFVDAVSRKAVEKVLETTCDGLTYSENIAKLPKDKGKILFSNHRDIVLDSTIMNKILRDCGMGISHSAIGDNLVPNDELRQIAKINNLFIVHRSLSLRETLTNSKLLSEYIEYLISQKHQTVWLAQREGRTKDGNDQTHSGVLKMLTMAAEGSIIEHLRKLCITPMAVSYEYDPTALLKIPAMLAAQRAENYVKAPGEDLKSIITGALGYKGRVSISISEPLDKELDELKEIKQPTQQLRQLAEIIDKKIHNLYKLFPTNYIAYDILSGTKKFKTEYSDQEKQKFEKLALENLQPNSRERQLVLKMYAMPVVKKFNLEPFQ